MNSINGAKPVMRLTTRNTLELTSFRVHNVLTDRRPWKH
jgi:hypothetical protein